MTWYYCFECRFALSQGCKLRFLSKRNKIETSRVKKGGCKYHIGATKQIGNVLVPVHAQIPIFFVC